MMNSPISDQAEYCTTATQEAEATGAVFGLTRSSVVSTLKGSSFISKKSLDGHERKMGYVSKLTSAGQLTIPKEIRRRLGLQTSSLVVLDEVGDVVLLRRFETDEATLAIVRSKLRKTGLTRRRVNEIVERERAKLWKEKTKDLH